MIVFLKPYALNSRKPFMGCSHKVGTRITNFILHGSGPLDHAEFDYLRGEKLDWLTHRGPRTMFKDWIGHDGELENIRHDPRFASLVGSLADDADAS